MAESTSERQRVQVLLVDDDAYFRGTLADELIASQYDVAQAANGKELDERLADGEPDVVLLDLKLRGEDGLSLLESIKQRSSSAVIMLTGHGTVSTAIRAMKLGAADYLTKPCDLDELELTIERVLETRRLRERNEILEQGLTRSELDMVGSSPAFRRLIREIERAARSRSAVLVYGESGTGKELVARRLHRLSPARNKPFVVVDCTALSDELMNNELFGHEKGAYTGASERKHGLFEVADGGSLCLDEVGEISPRVQAKLLRVLDGGTFRRTGGTQEIRTDVRVISSTNRQLSDLVRAGSFREDLYYRLSPLMIQVPPLRERREDVPLLAQHFFSLAVRRQADPPRLEAAALAALTDYPWPGNVRELAGAVERLVVFRAGQSIGADEVNELLGRGGAPAVPVQGHLTLQEVERRHIEAVLDHCGGHRGEAARILGISERTLYRKLGQLGRSRDGLA